MKICQTGEDDEEETNFSRWILIFTSLSWDFEPCVHVVYNLISFEPFSNWIIKLPMNLFICHGRNKKGKEEKINWKRRGKRNCKESEWEREKQPKHGSEKN